MNKTLEELRALQIEQTSRQQELFNRIEECKLNGSQYSPEFFQLQQE